MSKNRLESPREKGRTKRKISSAERVCHLQTIRLFSQELVTGTKWFQSQSSDLMNRGNINLETVGKHLCCLAGLFKYWVGKQGNRAFSGRKMTKMFKKKEEEEEDKKGRRENGRGREIIVV